MIPTTDQMDHTTPEERHDLVGLCEAHGHTVRFHGVTGKRVCPEGSAVIQATVRSWRTFNDEWAKKERLKFYERRKNNESVSSM